MFGIVEGIQKTLVEEGEYESLSCDGTFKVCLSVTDQPKHGAAVKDKDAPRRREHEVHVVETILTKTGCMIDAVPLFSEKPESVVKAMKATVGTYSNKVKVVKTDRAPVLDNCPNLRVEFKKLEGDIGDSLHRPIELETCLGERRTECSSALR